MAKSGISTSGPEQTVCSRRVHYISGFDPRGVRYYHQLYTEEAAKQARLLGATLEVGKRERRGLHVFGWPVVGQWNGRTVTTDYEFMAWDDLVRQHWETSLVKLAWQSAVYYVGCSLLGGFPRLRTIAKGAAYTAFYPLTYFLVLLGMAWLFILLSTIVIGHGFLGMLIGLALAGVLVLLGIRHMESLGAFWVLRTCVFLYGWGKRPIPALDERIAAMAEHIRQAQKTNPVDEVLIVGHSVGTIVAAAVTARLLEHTPPDHDLGPFHLLTLGECIPYVSLMPTAVALRRDLAVLGDDDRIAWTDATSPPDPLCFYQIDPLRVSGLTPKCADRPKLTNVRIFKMFTPETYRTMRWNKIRLHFQYLMANEIPADYDFFKITAGPHRLKD